MDTKLIMVEGLPGTGKSQVAHYTALQLNNNGIKTEWYYDMETENPLDYAYEAYFNETEFSALIKKFSEYELLLKNEAMKTGDKYIIKYAALNRKYKQNIDPELIGYLEEVDISSLTMPEYKQFKLRKFTDYFRTVKDTVTVIESSYIQEPVTELLLRNEKPAVIKNFVRELAKTIRKSQPFLIYLFQQDVKKTVSDMLKDEGTEFEKNITALLEASPFGKVANTKGRELIIKFFEDYHELATEIYNRTHFAKLGIDVNEQKWDDYYSEILSTLEIEKKPEYFVPDEVLKSYTGKYKNDSLKQTFFVKFDENGLYLHINPNHRDKLIPVNLNSFHCLGTTIDVNFLKAENNEIDRFLVTGRDTVSPYGECGNVFKKPE